MQSKIRGNIRKNVVKVRNSFGRMRRGALTRSSFAEIQNRVRKSYGVKNGQKKRTLLVTSNGAGLGHLTRLNAVSQHLDGEVLFYTMSSAYRKLNKPKGSIIYFPSYGDLGMNGNDWNRFFYPHFDAIVAEFQPDVIVFDGTYIYRPVTEVSREHEIPLVWMQRGCWKPLVDSRSVQRHNAIDFCDAVVVPGDYGCTETVDSGSGLTPEYVGPIISTKSNERITREQAIEVLHLPKGKKFALIQVGAGVINETADLQSEAISAVSSLGEDWIPVLVKNPLQAQPLDTRALLIEGYPLAKYYSAFEFGIFAAGYNTVQESIAFELPAVFVPNLSTKTDDQARRAGSIESQNMGFMATDGLSLRNAIADISSEFTRQGMKRAMKLNAQEDGAAEAAIFISKTGATNPVENETTRRG